MSKMKEVALKCELALMGVVTPMDDNYEAVAVLDGILTTMRAMRVPVEENLTGEKVLTEQVNKFGNNKIRHIVCNTIGGMRMIAMTLESYPSEDDEEEEVEEFPEDLTTDMGVFSYVMNLDEPMFSELGYTFYEKHKDDTYHRVG